MSKELPRLMSPKEAAAETTFSAMQLNILSTTGLSIPKASTTIGAPYRLRSVRSDGLA